MAYDPAVSAASGPGDHTSLGPFSDPNPETTLAPAELPADLSDAARRLFGDRLPLAVAYAELLVTDGVLRGLIGPREAPRIWERHLLNCAPVAELIPADISVLDVGSGAGLPGIVLAIARPDLSIALIEPLARRTAFLTEVVRALGLDDSVTVIRGRAEEMAGEPAAGNFVPAEVVTARAVAPLDRLAGWCLPLTALGGRLLALKGATAADEVAEHTDAVSRLGGSQPIVRRCGVGVIDPPTTVVEILRERLVEAPRVKETGARASRTRSDRAVARPGPRSARGKGRWG